MGTSTGLTGFDNINDIIGSPGSILDGSGFSGDFTSSVAVSGFGSMQWHILGNFTGQLYAPTEGTAAAPVSVAQATGLV